ncbi:hypothetical protein GCM10027403_06680 [Arthrobacter tecti]
MGDGGLDYRSTLRVGKVLVLAERAVGGYAVAAILGKPGHVLAIVLEVHLERSSFRLAEGQCSGYEDAVPRLGAGNGAG